jgi:hypothetical protein
MVSLLLVWCIVCALAPAAAFAVTLPVTVEVKNGSGAPGTPVTLAVYMDSGGITDYSLNMTYDTSRLELQPDPNGVKNAVVLSTSFNAITSTVGEIEITSQSIVVGKEKMFDLYFKIKDNAPSGDASVTIVSGTYSDNSGLTSPSIESQNITSGKITVTGPPDTTAPTVTQSTYATNLAVGANLELTFNESVTAVSGKTILIKKKSDDSTALTIDAGDTTVVTVSGANVTINPTVDLAYGTEYYGLIEAGAFKDAADNNFAGILSSTTWTFATAAAPDTTAPTVAQSTYATNLPVGANLELTFSEPVTAVAGKNITIKKKSNDSVALTIDAGDTTTVTVSGANVTINPTVDLAYGTEYYVLIEAGAFKDAAGNDFAGIPDSTTWPFATELAAQGSVTIGIGTAGGLAGSTVTVPVSIIQASTGIASYGIQIDFDAAGLEAISVDGTASGQIFDFVVDNTNGAVKAGWADITGGSKTLQSGELFKIQFKIKDSAHDWPLTVVENDPKHFTFSDGSFNELSKTLTAGKITMRKVPGAPTAVTAAAGDGSATVSFSAPADIGDSPITGYTVTSSPGGLTASGASSPITVTGLTNGTAYTFTVVATNGAGNGPASAPSNSVVPEQPSEEPGSGYGGGGTDIPVGPAAPSAPEATNSGVEVIVNGKAENAGTATHTVVNGQSVTTIAIDPVKLAERLAVEGNHAVITIPVRTDSDVVIGELNGQMVKGMEQTQAIVRIETDRASYTLPAQQINIGAILEQFGGNVSLQDIKIRIEIATPDANTVKLLEGAAANNEFTLVVPPLEFKVTAVYNGSTVDVSTFNAYVERTIAIPEGIDPNKITTGVVVEADGTVRHVPTKIVRENGKYYAQVNSLTNSTYSVIWHPLEFSDAAAHWAKDAVNDMGSRMIVNGFEDGTYQPDRDMTRAEFAAIMIRGLGLKPESGKAQFSDVKAGDWYKDAIQTASAYALIDGFADGTFRPNDKITREQAMVIIARAMAITGLKDKLQGQDADERIRMFADANEMAAWAKAGVSDALLAGIVNGRTDETLAPQAYVTRAEVAVMVRNLLRGSVLI